MVPSAQPEIRKLQLKTVQVVLGYVDSVSVVKIHAPIIFRDEKTTSSRRTGTVCGYFENHFVTYNHVILSIFVNDKTNIYKRSSPASLVHVLFVKGSKIHEHDIETCKIYFNTFGTEIICILILCLCYIFGRSNCTFVLQQCTQKSIRQNNNIGISTTFNNTRIRMLLFTKKVIRT